MLGLSSMAVLARYLLLIGKTAFFSRKWKHRIFPLYFLAPTNPSVPQSMGLHPAEMKQNGAEASQLEGTRSISCWHLMATDLLLQCAGIGINYLNYLGMDVPAFPFYYSTISDFTRVSSSHYFILFESISPKEAVWQHPQIRGWMSSSNNVSDSSRSQCQNSTNTGVTTIQ